MIRKKIAAIFFLLTAWIMSTTCYSQDHGIPIDRNLELPVRDMQVENLSRSQMEENRWNAYLDESGRRRMNESQQNGLDNSGQTDSVTARFINQRPELGCLFYDENDVRHWQPNCHE